MKEIDHPAYIHAIGVDHEDGQVVVYAQLISFSWLAKVEAEGRKRKINRYDRKSNGRDV